MTDHLLPGITATRVETPRLTQQVLAPEGAELNSPDQVSPAEPVQGHVLDPAGSVH